MYILYLNKKHYEFNGTVEDTIITVADWNKELRPFRIDINKPAWVAHVKIDSNAVSFAEYAIEYTFDSDKIPYRKAIIIYEDAQMSNVLEILIVYRSDNYLYKAERELIYHSRDGYQINGVQDVKVLEDANYLIKAKFIAFLNIIPNIRVYHNRSFILILFSHKH